jgi:hypothetical protein
MIRRTFNAVAEEFRNTGGPLGHPVKIVIITTTPSMPHPSTRNLLDKKL